MTVVQKDEIVNIAEEDLCKGDILLLQAGDLVPADLKLLESRSLEVDEFELTGEIRPADKKVDGEEVFVYRGSKVIRGNGKGIVTATGDETEYGEILKQRWGQVKLISLPNKGKIFCVTCRSFATIYCLLNPIQQPCLSLRNVLGTDGSCRITTE